LKLVIIAAGLGSRLSKVSNGTPKILVNVFEKPLIDQLLSNCIDSGINDVVIVTGFNDHIIKEYLSRIKTPVTIEIAYNPEWNLANGVSVLAAKKFIPKNEEFLISMSDHYYNNLILTMMKNHTNENTIASVGADYKIDDIHDIDDGMKIKINNNTKLIEAMSKELSIYNAIDCGIFKCKYEFFHYLKKAKEENRCSISDACNLLIKKDLMGSVDIQDNPWIDIDTPEALNFINNNREKFVK